MQLYESKPKAWLSRAKIFTAPLMASVFLLLSLPSLQAESVARKQNIAGKTVFLGLPEKTCPLSPKNPSDRLLIDGVKTSIKGSNELLMQFADCQELKDWRSGKQKYLNNFGSYQTSVRLKATDMTGREQATVAEICKVFKKQGAAMLQNMKPEIDKRLDDGFKNIKMNELKMLGIVHEDSNICAAATFQRFKTDDQSIKDQINVYSVTFLNGRIIFTYLYAPHGDPDIIPKLTQTITKLNDYNQLRNKKKN